MTARALVVQHTATEGPGWLAEWLPAAGVKLDVVRPYAGAPLPAAVGADALVVLGGAIGAGDEDVAPWLPATRRLLAQAVEDSVPVLGICLGGQLLAAACGGRVQRGPAGPEIGVGTIRLRPAARADALFGGLPATVRSVQWHYDGVTELPSGAVGLAESAAYPHQAFRLGERAWGVQFHPEAEAATVAGWARDDRADLEAAGIDPATVRAEVIAAEAELSETWQDFARRFAAVVTG